MISGNEILRRVKAGTIKISDFDIKRLNPNSYNLRLDRKMMMYDMCHEDMPSMDINQIPLHHNLNTNTIAQYVKTRRILRPGTHSIQEDTILLNYLDSKMDNPTIEFEIGDDGVILFPGVLYLGSTIESTYAEGLVPCIDGRSSTGRLGIEIHRTAGFGDNGFNGTWTLEITCVHPVKIYYGQEICQIYFEELTGDPTFMYNGKYQNQNGVVPSKMYKDNNYEVFDKMYRALVEGEIEDVVNSIFEKPSNDPHA